MWFHRIIYIFMLAISGLFFVLSPSWFAWYFFILTLLVFPFDIIISLPGMITRRLSVSAPSSLEQREMGDIVVTVQSPGRFPSGQLRARLLVKGNDKAYVRRLKIGGARGSRSGAPIDTEHSSVTAFRFKRFWASSLLGLISVPVPFRHSVTVLVLPLSVKPPGDVALPQTAMLRPKPGGGPSEEHDLRPYREGDQIKTVHWKLSAKHDSLIVREALAPPSHSRLIHVSKWNRPADRDLILGRLRWVSNYLLERDLPHFVKFGENLNIEEISGYDDLVNCLYHALDSASRVANVSASARGRFTWVYKIDASGGQSGKGSA